MNTRKTLITVSIVVIIAVVFFLVNRGGGDEKDSMKAALNSTPLRTFEAVAIQKEDPAIKIPITGRILAVEKIDLYPEVSGKLLKGSKPFKEGITFQRGQLLLRLDAASFTLDLNATKSDFLSTLIRVMPDLKMDFPEHYEPWETYLKNFNIEERLQTMPSVTDDRLKYFLASESIYNLYYNIQRLENDLKKYQVVAPFKGVLGSALVNPGAQVGTQTQLGTFSSIEAFELETSISLSDLNYVAEGDEVMLENKEMNREWKGIIHRIGKVVDDANQQLSIFIKIQGDDLREGMFLEGVIDVDRKANSSVSILPKESVIRNNQVYVVRDSTVFAKSIIPVRYEQKSIWVTGLVNGDVVIKDPGTEQIHGIKAIAKIN